MTQTEAPLFTGTAGRRTFVREADAGAIIVYSIAAFSGAIEERFCSRAEWNAWCAQHAPPVARPGMTVVGHARSVTVIRELSPGHLEIAVSETRIMSQDKADRLVRRLSAEAKRSPASAGEPQAGPDDDAA